MPGIMFWSSVISVPDKYATFGFYYFVSKMYFEVYRRQCPNCKDQSCYSDTNGAIRCCNDACTGGCTGSGPENCLVNNCVNYENKIYAKIIRLVNASNRMGNA